MIEKKTFEIQDWIFLTEGQNNFGNKIPFQIDNIFFLYQLHAFKNIWMIQVTNFKFSIAIVIVNSALQLSKKVFSDLQDFFHPFLYRLIQFLHAYLIIWKIQVFKNVSKFRLSFLNAVVSWKSELKQFSKYLTTYTTLICFC